MTSGPLESECMVEMWGHGGIPGTANQRTSLESAEVVGKVGDDHFHDIIWELWGDRFVRETWLWGHISGEAIGIGSASVPGGRRVGREVYP